MMKGWKPLELLPARAWRTYLGGRQIDQMHGKTDPEDSHFPEEWIMSVVTARNPGREAIRDEGLSYMKGKDGRAEGTLKQQLEAFPEELLGAGHARRYGAKTGVLVKIIDSSERLTIQVHPDKEAAKRLFGSEFGKTECWHILRTREDMGEKPCIYLGFREGVTRELWQELFEKQDIPQMLGCLHRIEVKPGDTFIIHGGVPHAIGAGCMLLEIQEPTDYTIRTERVTPAGLQIADEQCHQGLGFQQMFDCFHYQGCGLEQAKVMWQVPGRILSDDEQGIFHSVVDGETTPCFRLEKYQVRKAMVLGNRGVFSGIYVIAGEGELSCTSQTYAVQPGSQFFLPAACGAVQVKRTGEDALELFRFYGPEL